MTQPLSDRSYQALARFRHALRVFERFSEDAARDAGHHSGPAPAAARHPGPPGPGCAVAVGRRGHASAQAALGRRARRSSRGQGPRGPLGRSRRPPPGPPARSPPKGEAKLAELSVLHRQELRRFRQEMNDVLARARRSDRGATASTAARTTSLVASPRATSGRTRPRADGRHRQPGATWKRARRRWRRWSHQRSSAGHGPAQAGDRRPAPTGDRQPGRELRWPCPGR